MKGNRVCWVRFVIFATVVAFLGGCTGRGLFNAKLFKERAAETPIPTEEGIEKSFFRNADGTYKTFLCAWAPEVARGWVGEKILTRLVNGAMHCNIVFDITEDALVGKMINPSYVEGAEPITQKHVDKFKEVLKLPISKHYYYERARDAHGRETNEWIENDGRSHWTARPYIKVNLGGVSVTDFIGSEFGGGSVSSVEDIEWDKANGFLGFSANMVFSVPRWISKDEYQGKIRFNFLKFDHDPTFDKTPYHQENSRYMNILHVVGRQIEGVEQELYAAHWDLRKPTTIYISGAPTHIAPTIVKAVEKWNTTLREIGAIPRNAVAFVPVIRELKHPFDLRYTTINWIQDKRISLNSPLGIGMAHSDVRNGKILWGGVVMYGGLLENYISRYAPIESAASSTSEMLAQAPLASFSHIFPEKMDIMTQVAGVSENARSSLILNMSTNNSSNLEMELTELQAKQEMDPVKIEALREQVAQMRDGNPALTTIVMDLISEAKKEQSEIGQYFRQNNLRRMYGNPEVTAEMASNELSSDNPLLVSALSETNQNRRTEMLSQMHSRRTPFFIEEDRNVINMSGSWMSSPAQMTRTYPEILESVTMELVLHEIGHMIGLGHQFKENIVPAAGTVPERYVTKLAALATAEKEFTNYTSVMGYKNGRTEMMLAEDELAPGPHDELVLRYLYNKQYTSYDRHADRWIYTQVPESGKIPQYSRVRDTQGVVTNLPTSYFPQCNDYEASLAADPFCNRWDRGSKAEDIVASYFSQVSDNLLSTLYSLVGGGSAFWTHEYYLWRTSLGTFSRVRLFYDEMRRRLRSEERLIPLWDQLRRDKDSLFEFAEACQKPNPTSPDQVNSDILRRLFAHKDIVDLCRANALALREYRFFLNLPEGDYTRIDTTNRYISGGYLEGDATRDWGNIMGSWFQLSNFPLKFTTMYTLATANAYQFHPHYLWVWPNMYYDHEDNRFLYRTLYPRDYTKLISDAVQNNMRFAATGMDSTTSLGKTVLSTSWLLPWQKWTSNDPARLPRDYNDMLDQQTQFSMSMVAVIISAVKPDANSNVRADYYKKFTASVYDFFTGKSSTAREVYILPKGDVIVWANGMFIYPITKIKFYDGTNSYVIAYKVSFDYEEGDQLVEDSVKSALLEKHKTIAEQCIDGFNRNGLANYFNDTQRDFEGLYIPPGIASETGKEKTGLFYESLERAFQKYEAYATPQIPDSFPIKSMRRVCDESVRGIGQISAAAALVNGYWLRITPEYLVK